MSEDIVQCILSRRASILLYYWRNDRNVSAKKNRLTFSETLMIFIIRSFTNFSQWKSSEWFRWWRI